MKNITLSVRFKKRFLPILSFMMLLNMASLKASDTNSKLDTVPQTQNAPPPPPSIEEKVFTVVEQMPRFPGCEDKDGLNKVKANCAKDKMNEFISKNLEYPEEAKDKGVDGIAVVRFTVDIDGSLFDIKLLKDPGSGMGEAALAVVELMNEMEGKWTPGHQRGRKVLVLYTVKVEFKL